MDWYGESWIMMILLWAIIIALIVAGVRWIIGMGHGESRNRALLDILRERLARGEITKEQHEDLKRTLGQ